MLLSDKKMMKEKTASANQQLGALLMMGFVLITIPQLSTAQTFTKVIAGPLVNTPGDSRSVNWVDANGDGYIDCMITNGLAGGQNNFLYLNNGNGTFAAVTNDTIVKDSKPSDGATWADMDNDGDLDCFVVNWYNINNMMYSNDGNANFSQVSAQPPVTDLGYSETASWGDYDNDGLVDLYVANSAGAKKNFLYHNDGSGVFTKITVGTAVNDAFDSRCANWTDMDNDGDLDLFVANEANQHENIYRNDSGTFVKITTGALVTDGGKTMSSSWGDYDNDGDMDVFLANDQGNDALFRNDGNFTFVKMSADTVCNSGGNSFSSAWSDIDNDGDIDLFVTNSFWSAGLHNNFLFLNNGNGTFTRVNNTAPATDLDWSYGCAFGDYNNDGFEDLAVATCRFGGVDRPDLLYQNDGNSNHWITINLTGVASNKSAIGTKVRLKATINGIPVWQMREISAQTSACGQNDLRAHFGLGDATVADTIIFEWPSGATDICTNINANTFYNQTEGQCLVPVTVADNQIPKTKLQINAFPNPASHELTVSVYSDKHRAATIDLLDSSSRLLKTIFDGMLNMGENKFKITEFKNLATGNYMVVCESEGEKVFVKLVKAD